jgi:nucleotide-binding universal stress UspA family protein
VSNTGPTPGAAPDPVLVGVDGSLTARGALEWAAVEARMTRLPLHIVHCSPVMASPLGSSDGLMELVPAPARQRAGDVSTVKSDRLLVETEIFARLVSPKIEVSSELVLGDPVPVLLRRSEDAALTVVGARGLRDDPRIPLGSVSDALAARAPCPVVVVPAELQAGWREAEVLVGVDASGESMSALKFGIETAARRGVGITALLAWPELPSGSASISTATEVEHEYRRWLVKTANAKRQQFTRVKVSCQVVHERPESALVAAAMGAGLVVVGSRGRSPHRGLLSGAVRQAVLRHSPCPVVVVRARE